MVSVHSPAVTESLVRIRRSARLRVRLELQISWEEDAATRSDDAHTIMVSRFGCLLRARKEFRPGTQLLLEYSGKARRGQVVYCLNDRSRQAVDLGVAFESDGSEFWGVSFD